MALLGVEVHQLLGRVVFSRDVPRSPAALPEGYFVWRARRGRCFFVWRNNTGPDKPPQQQKQKHFLQCERCLSFLFFEGLLRRIISNARPYADRG
jgi:hypothetical protein